jgi:hypothetical protein
MCAVVRIVKSWLPPSLFGNVVMTVIVGVAIGSVIRHCGRKDLQV